MVWLEEFKRYVTKDGLVYSKTRGDKLKLLKQHVKKGRAGGYLMVSVDRKYDPITRTYSGRSDYPVHRLVALAFVPNPENKPNVDHIDRDKANPVWSNLRWVNQTENNLNTDRSDRLTEIGLRAGTPEYHKWWSEQHADYLKQYFHERYSNNKECYKKKNHEAYLRRKNASTHTD